MIGLPLSYDQFSNCGVAVHRAGTAVLLDMDTFTETQLLDAINKILNDPSYTMNAKRAQLISRDQPMSAKDQFLYWVNYTIQHRGATHLVSQVAHELNFFQFWSIDIVLFLVAMGTLLSCTFLFISLKLIKFFNVLTFKSPN